MLSFNPYCWSTLHITWTPAFGEFMPHYSPQLVERWTCVSSPLLSHTPHRRRTGGSRGATMRSSIRSRWCLPIDLRQGRSLVRFIFTFYFVILPLCNKYSDYIVTIISIHYYYICCLIWHMYEMHPALSLKIGCDMCNLCTVLETGILAVLTVMSSLESSFD